MTSHTTQFVIISGFFILLALSYAHSGYTRILTISDTGNVVVQKSQHTSQFLVNEHEEVQAIQYRSKMQ